MTTLRLPGESCSERPSISTLPPTAKLTSWSATGQMPVPPATAASRSGSACRRSPSCIGHARRAAAQSHDEAVHQAGEADQDDAEPQRQREVPLRGLQRDGRGHPEGHVVAVAAYDVYGPEQIGRSSVREKVCKSV